ncbi:MAG: efflux RND transporter periplasmic adaptor subunit [Acidobacteria bacterium]|nr:efflux RND transporter periplasmic adaptor subunit [Acidobacteriota bacterium]
MIPIVSGFLLALNCGCSENTRAKGGAGPVSVPVTVAPVIQQPMPVQIRAIGTVKAFSSVAVKTQISGPIQTVNFSEGQEVRQGQPLCRIDPAPFEANLQRAEAALERSRANLERDRLLAANADADRQRYAELVAKDYVTQQQYDAVRTNAEALQATLLADLAAVRESEAAVRNARLELGYCSVYAPMDGRTGELLVHAGNMVKQNDTVLVNIYQIRPVFVDFSVPEQELTRIRTQLRQEVLAVSALIPDAGLPAETGTITFLDSLVRPGTGTVHLKATFANKKSTLWPGQFVDVVLVLAIEHQAQVIPSQAVQTGQDGTFVFVLREDKTVEMRPVTVDRMMDGLSIISDGLTAGETVVTDGQMRLVSGARVVIRQSSETGMVAQ